MNNVEFLEKAFRDRAPKMIAGFSRPVYHNLAGIFFGHRYDKSQNGGMIRHTEGAMLFLWASRLAPGSTILEIGCYGGLSTSYLAEGCKKSRSKVFSIDPFDSEIEKQATLCDQAVSLERKPSREIVAARLRARGLESYVELKQGFAEEFVQHWKGPIHFLWVDGNHNRAGEDYLDWSPFLAPRARVAFHDAHPRYGLPHVAQAVQDIFGSDEWGELEHVKGILTAVRKQEVFLQPGATLRPPGSSRRAS